MIYPYRCECGTSFDVVKAMADAAREEKCQCGKVAQRVFCAPLIGGAKVFNAEYYPSLGKVIHNKRELRTELDRRNLVEVGNDFKSGESMANHFEKARNEERERGWERLLP